MSPSLRNMVCRAVFAILAALSAVGCTDLDPSRHEFTIRSADDVKLSGAVLPPKASLGPTGKTPATAVISHPWLTDRNRLSGIANELRKRGWQVVVYDLRGHGRSGIAETTFGGMEASDLATIIRELQAEGQIGRDVFVLGASLGATTSLNYAATHPACRGALAITPVDGLRGAVKQIHPLSSEDEREELARRDARKYGFDLDGSQPSIAGRTAACPMILVVAEQDLVVPREQTDAIYDAWAGPKRLYRLTGGHGSVQVGRDRYYADRMTDLLRMAEAERPTKRAEQ